MINSIKEIKRLVGIKEYPGVMVDEVTFLFNGNEITATRFFHEKNMLPRALIYCHGGFEYLPKGDYPGAAFFASIGLVVFVIKYEIEGIEKCDLMADVREIYDTVQFLKQTYKKLADISIVGVSRGTAPAGHAARMFPAVFRKVALVVGPMYIPTMRLSTVEGVKKGSAIPPTTLEKVIKYLNYCGDEEKSSLVLHAKELSQIPIGLFYGNTDIIVPNSPNEKDIQYRQGAYMWQSLQEFNNPKNIYKTYDHGHSLMNEREVQGDIARWLYI